MTMFVFLHSIFDDNVAEIETYMKNGLKYKFEAEPDLAKNLCIYILRRI